MLQRKYAEDILQNDHNQIRADLNALSLRFEERPEELDFERWKYETLWSMEGLLLQMRRHFYLEETLATQVADSAPSSEQLHKMARIEREHSLLTDEFQRMVTLMHALQYGDVLRQHHMGRQLQAFRDSVEKHEHVEETPLGDLVGEFDRSGRLFTRPTFSLAELQGFEKELGVPLPVAYKQALAAGEYEKANFEFVKPYREAPHYVIFARWNDVRFAFDTRNGPDYPVWVLVDQLKPARSYQNFLEWLHLVYKTTAGVNNPD